MVLIKNGYWQDTYWPSRYWQEDYWPERGVSAAVEGDVWVTEQRQIPISFLLLIRKWLMDKESFTVT